jgi:hypothetical protein
VPSGWTLVAFAGNQTTSCPSQSTQSDVYEGPNASSACGCNCQVTTMPTCAAGPINVMYDANFNHSPLSCNMAGSPAQMKNQSSCNTDMYGGGAILGYKSLDLSYTLPPPTGGQCTASSVETSSALTYAAQDRICTPNTEPCTGNECTPSFGGLDVCVAANGNMACPGSPFTHQHIVGGAATFTCSGSSCGCSLTGTCTGTVTLYTSMNCTGGANTTLVIPADGQCHDESAAGSNSYASYSYAANPPPSSCDPTGTSTAQNVTQPNLQTVCCTQ